MKRRALGLDVGQQLGGHERLGQQKALRDVAAAAAEQWVLQYSASLVELVPAVLPERPAGSEHLDLDALAALVSRDCMIGVALPSVPA